MSAATQIRLKIRAEGVPQDDVWETTHDAPAEPADGEIAVEVEYISVDPAMRGWMIDTPSYVPPVALGEVMRAGGIGQGQVIASNTDKFAVGEGKLRRDEHIVDGIESFPEALRMLFDGRNKGKLIVKIK